MRAKDSIEDVILEPYGIKAGIRHLGVGQARQWASALKAAHQAELERVYLKRLDLEAKGLKDDFPEYWEKDEDGNVKVTTKEGEDQADSIVESMLADALAYLGDAQGPEAVAEAVRLGLSHKLVEPIMRVQNPSNEEIFS